MWKTTVVIAVKPVFIIKGLAEFFHRGADGQLVWGKFYVHVFCISPRRGQLESGAQSHAENAQAQAEYKQPEA